MRIINRNNQHAKTRGVTEDMKDLGRGTGRQLHLLQRQTLLARQQAESERRRNEANLTQECCRQILDWKPSVREKSLAIVADIARESKHSWQMSQSQRELMVEMRRSALERERQLQEAVRCWQE